MVSPWIHELSAAVTSSQSIPSFPSCEVRFRVGENQFGLDLSSGIVTEGSKAQAEISGGEGTFENIIQGRDTLQAAYRAGRVTLIGDPEPFLRLSVLLDRCASLRVCVQ